MLQDEISIYLLQLNPRCSHLLETISETFGNLEAEAALSRGKIYAPQNALLLLLPSMKATFDPGKGGGKGRRCALKTPGFICVNEKEPMPAHFTI